MRGWAALLLALAVSPPAYTAEPLVLYRHATLIDVVAGKALPDMAILTRGERIVRIAPSRDLAGPPGAALVEASGLFVAPGLINSHVHLATPPDRPLAEANLRRALFGGVTTVRDMADDLRQVGDLARAARVGEIPSPDIYYAALMAGPRFFDDPRTHATTAGAIAGEVPWMRAVTASTDLTRAVAEAKGTGATAIKIYADLPAPLVVAITHEAHRQGLKVWAHAAVFPARPSDDLDAGVDSVSHVCMLAYQASAQMPRAYDHRAGVDEARFAGRIDPAVQALFDRIRAQGTVLDATLWIYQEMARDHAAEPTSPAPYCSEALAARLAHQAWVSGDLISTGTDDFPPSSDPWTGLDQEMLALQNAAGLPPLAVLRGATLVGARAVGREGEIGVLAPGALANMVFVRQNPLADVAAFKTVVLTVKRGKAYWRKDFQPIPADGASDPR